MKITCPKCSTAYDVNSESFGTAGRGVKCTRCGTRWHVDSPAEMVTPASAAESKKSGRDTPGKAKIKDIVWQEAGDDIAEDEDAVAGQDGAGSSAAIEMTGIASTEKAVVVQKPPPAESKTAEMAKLPEKPVDIESLAKRPKIRVRRRRRKREGPSILTRLNAKAQRIKLHRVAGAFIFAAALAIGAMAMNFREEIVARVPDLAGLYSLAGFKVNLRGLEFSDLRTFREVESGTIVLVIEGTIENPTRKATYVPAVRLALRSEDAQEIYAWIVEPKVRQLEAGATARFRTRLASPPDQAADIHVRFTERRNQQAKL